MRQEQGREGSGRFSSLRKPGFRKLFIGGLFTFLAMQVSVVARAWLAFELTGNNTGLGGTMLAFGIATIVAIPYGGLLADRFNKRRILLLAGSIQTATPLILGVTLATGSVSYELLLLASAAQGAMISILAPARLAFIADVVGRDTLTNAVFLSMSTVQLARVVGPAAAGTLIGTAFFGLEGVFFSAAALGALSIALLAGLPPGAPTNPSQRSAIADLADGLRFLRSRPDLMHLLAVSFGVVLVGFPYMTFLPVIADRILDVGSTGFGLLNAVSAVGALLGAIAMADVQRRQMQRFQAGAAVVFGFSLAAFAGAPGFVASLVVIAVVGAASSVFQALNNSLLLTLTPVEYHGRMQSLLMLSFSGASIAALPFGLIADAVGVRTTLVAMAVMVTAVMGVARLTQPRPHPEEAAL